MPAGIDGVPDNNDVSWRMWKRLPHSPAILFFLWNLRFIHLVILRLKSKLSRLSLQRSRKIWLRAFGEPRKAVPAAFLPRNSPTSSTAWAGDAITASPRELIRLQPRDSNSLAHCDWL